MDSLFEASSTLVRSIGVSFERYLANQIDWSDRLIAVKGGRGTGKTTLILQQGEKAKRMRKLKISPILIWPLMIL